MAEESSNRDKAQVWDPLRKKHVALTPEERVRQWFIKVLAEDCGIPLHMMMSEAGFNLGEKRLRADIIAYSRDLSPWLVVECKRPEVPLDAKVLDQAVRYNMVLGVRYILITNGNSTCCLARQGEGTEFRVIESLPQWKKEQE